MQNARITLHPNQQRMQVQVAGILLGDSTNAVELRELGEERSVWHFTENNYHFAITWRWDSCTLKRLLYGIFVV